MGLQRSMSARSKAGAKWLSKIRKGGQIQQKRSASVSFVRLSPFGSQLSVVNAVKIENVVDWEAIARKYRNITGEDQIPFKEKMPNSGNMDDALTEESSINTSSQTRT